jgi:hypothetical protein
MKSLKKKISNCRYGSGSNYGKSIAFKVVDQIEECTRSDSVINLSYNMLLKVIKDIRLKTRNKIRREKRHYEI